MTIDRFPSLPQTEPDPERRAAKIASDRATYELDYSYHDLPFARRYLDLPLSDRVSPRYEIKRTELRATIGANMAAQKVVDILEAPPGEDRILHTARKIFEVMAKRLDAPPAFARYNRPDPERDVAQKRKPLDYADYLGLYRLFLPPTLAEGWDGIDAPRLTDASFAAQRVAGTNPVLLERLTALSDRLPVTNAHLAQALEVQGEAPITLEAALGEGRLYLVDMSILDGLPTSMAEGDRLQQFLYAPLSLYLRVPRKGHRQEPLVPVAIQLAPRPGGPIYTPSRDPEAALRWSMAKLAVQCSDSNHHGIVMHNAACHLMASRLVVGLRRSLADNHPVRILLEPHFEGTLKVVNEGTRDLVEPGGFTPLLQSVSLEGVFELLHRAFAEQTWDTFNPRRCYARRGVDDPVLEYPYRDDELRLLRIIEGFVEPYLRLYYHEDSAVAGDVELRALMDELEGPSRLHGIRRPLDSVRALTELVAEIIDRVSLLHTAINYSVFDYMSFPPNMPGALYAPGPDALDEVSEADLRRMLPPLEPSNLQIADTFFVQNMLLDPLGAYKHVHFADPRVRELTQDFARRLADEELLIGRDNASRFAPYEILLPSRISTSILV
ncbi:MAG: hypothetical protein KC731_09075 [Myxococcales bacterium]|nr:hypothetical protein [Myxococcales bacterium]